MVARAEGAPRILPARSWDVVARALLHDGARFRVHSAFEHAFNVVTPSGELVGVVVGLAPNGPATLVISSSPSLDVLVPGDAAHVDGGTLTVGRRLQIDLRGVTLWRPQPARRSLPSSEIAERLRRCADVASSQAQAGGLAALLQEAEVIATVGDPTPRPPPHCGGEGEMETGAIDLGAMDLGAMDLGAGGAMNYARTGPSPVGAQFIAPKSIAPAGGGVSPAIVEHGRQALVELSAAIRARDWAAAATTARALSGLGPGLTPSGDDALAGLALGLHAGLRQLPEPLAATLLVAVEDRTTDLAQARVRHAVANRPDETTHRLLAALVASQNDDDLAAAVRSSLAYGHSSGADTLLGLLVGLWLSLQVTAT